MKWYISNGSLFGEYHVNSAHSKGASKALIVDSQTAAPGIIKAFEERGIDHVLVHTNDQALEKLQSDSSFTTVSFRGMEQSVERTIQFLKDPRRGTRSKPPRSRRTPQVFSTSRL